MGLVVQSDLEAKLGRALTSEEASAFTVINAAIQSYVEKMIGSSVEAVSATTRYYDGGRQHLRIDPCTEVTLLELVDDDSVSTYTYDTTDYSVEPVNKTLKQMLRHRAGKFTTGINNIRVTAKFSIYGDSDTRNIVKNALISACLAELTNSKNVSRESIEGYSVDYISEEALASLTPIRFVIPEVV